MKDIIIIGAGGHAKVLLDTLYQLDGFNIVGLTDEDETKFGEVILRHKIIGNDNVIAKYGCDNLSLVNGLGLLKPYDLRCSLYQKYVIAGYNFPAIVNPSATVSCYAQIAVGVQIMAGVVIQANVKIAENVIINTRASIDHDTIIGKHSHVAPGVILAGGVTVGENTLIGVGAVVLPNIKIGNGCVIGAGAVVTDNVADAKTVVGIPAKGIEVTHD